MDAVSYANSAKQAKRIKKFIENPDSDSGIVTTPKVIQSGETITIPDGRMAVLPELTIEGDLVLEGTGDVFIPAGSTLTGTVTLDTAQTITGPKEFTTSPKVPDGVEPTDVVNKGQLDNSSISKVASSVLLSGNVAVDNSVITKSNANVTYTGNGTTQDIATGIDSVDFTVASNGSGYYHDRTAGDCIVKNDAGTIIESGSCVVNTSKVHTKNRDDTWFHQVVDGLRGVGNTIYTNSTSAEGVPADYITSFNNEGFSVNYGSSGSMQNHIAHQTLYTHIKWGLTSQGKRYIVAYNPVTREVMTMYQGSGISGHQIPNPLGIKLDYLEVKDLDVVKEWSVNGNLFDYLELNSTASDTGTKYVSLEDGYIDISISNSTNNTNNNTYISYGFANSETKIITQYQGTGVAGNFIPTRDVNGVARKPSRVITKATSITGSWVVLDYKREDKYILLSSSGAEVSLDVIDIFYNGFSLKETNGQNASGGRYIAIVEFDTTASNDDTYFDLPTDDTNLNVTNGKLAFTNGRSSNGGYKVETQDFTGSVDFSGISDGIKYIARDKLGNVFGYDGVSIGLYDKTSADDNRLVFDTESGKWFTTTGGELVTNGTFDTDVSGWTACTATIIGSGAVLSVDNKTLKAVATSANGGMCYKFNTTIGETYKISFDIVSTNDAIGIYSGLEEYSDIGYTTLENTVGSSNNGTLSTGTRYIEFTASYNYSSIYIVTGSTSGKTVQIDNISVYKKQATLGTELPNPICFVDDKPYQVTSGTPMDRLADYPSIPKNVMESTYVDGDLEVSGEVKGKNQCTAWVNFDGTTTPPTIRDSYNVNSVVRIVTGIYDVYFETPMDNVNYTFSVSGAEAAVREYYVRNLTYLKNNKLTVECGDVGFNGGVNPTLYVVQIFGGKN